MSFRLQAIILVMFNCYETNGLTIQQYDDEIKKSPSEYNLNYLPLADNNFGNLPQDGYLDPGRPQTVVELNPLIEALFLSRTLGLPEKLYSSNHPGLVPINPYIALILSNYGRYVPIPRLARGLYGYAATNNYLNNQPLGAYKVYEDK